MQTKRVSITEDYKGKLQKNCYPRSIESGFTDSQIME